MRIGLITTLDTNIGDDFIREGICFVLRKVFLGRKIEFVPVNKHRPMTVYPPSHPCRWAEWFPRGRRYAYPLVGKIFNRFEHSRFDNCDLIVQCGAPVFWPGCHRCEWAEPLWHQVVGRLHKRVPILNLAAGSCYAWEQQPTNIYDPRELEYIRSILGYCRMTTVRDTLAQNLCSSLDIQAPYIPCSAFLAAKECKNIQKYKEIVLINYMDGGGHYDWNQNIDRVLWHNTVKGLMNRMRKRHKVVFLCHNQEEYDLADQLDETLPRIWPKTFHEYISLVSKAKIALCNRMHASVVLAGLGIPSIAVGTDTRLLMVAALGLPNYYVKDVNVDQLEYDLEKLLARRAQERERLLTLQSATWSRYIDRVSESLKGTHLL